MPEGTVEVEVLKAQGLKDVETVGKSDPYVLLSCGSDLHHRTRTIHDGGSDPIWNQSFLFEVPDGVSDLKVAIFDAERHGKDESMGFAVISLAPVYAQREIATTKYKIQLPSRKYQGEIELRLKFFPKVHHGTLHLHLVGAHDLISADVFDKIDPYAIISCDKEVVKSLVLLDAGSNPVWDQNFEFAIQSEVTEVTIKLWDKDTFTTDDALGNVIVPLNKVFAEGFVPPCDYQVIGKKGQPQGTVRVGLKFIPKL